MYTEDQIKENISYLKADQVYENFDFEKVHQHMVATDWKWRDKVPTLQEIKSTAYSLLLNAVEEYYKTNRPYGNIGTGGFMVYYFPWGMELTFKLTWNNSY